MLGTERVLNAARGSLTCMLSNFYMALSLNWTLNGTPQQKDKGRHRKTASWNSLLPQAPLSDLHSNLSCSVEPKLKVGWGWLLLAVVVNMLWHRKRTSLVLLPPLMRKRGVSDIYGAAPKNRAFHRQKSSSHGLCCKSAMPALCTTERCWVTRYFCYTKKSGPGLWDHIVYMSHYRHSALRPPTNIFCSTSTAIPGHGQTQSPASKFLFTNGILTFCYKTRVLLTVNCQCVSVISSDL